MTGSVKIEPGFDPPIYSPIYFIKKRLANGIRKYAPQLSGRLLDFGCGQKPYKALFSHVSEYIGVDYDGEGHSHINEDIDVFYDGKTLPFPDQYFDCILTSEVFEHIFNLEVMLTELNRVMKPGARILITPPLAWPEHETPVDFGRY